LSLKSLDRDIRSRHHLDKRQALVELELMGAVREIRLMLEIIKKT
jgi:hypothetical protein